MFNFDKIVRTVSAAIFSLVLTTVAIGATIGPVPALGADRVMVAAAQTAEIAHG